MCLRFNFIYLSSHFDKAFLFVCVLVNFSKAFQTEYSQHNASHSIDGLFAKCQCKTVAIKFVVTRKQVLDPIFYEKRRRKSMAVQMERYENFVSKGYIYDHTGRNLARRYRPKAARDKIHQEEAVLSDFAKQVFPKGVRAPILADLASRDRGSRKTIRLDIVTKKRDATVRFFQSDSKQNKERLCEDSHGSQSLSPRSLKFLRSDGTTYRNMDHKSLSCGDAWDNWKENVMRKSKDARDVLYRNTYTDATSGIRYNPCKLPRISINRPWTVDGLESSKDKKSLWDNNVITKCNINGGDDLWRPRTMNSQRMECYKKTGSVADNYFEVRRINTNIDLIKDNSVSTMSLVRQPSDLGTEAEGNQRPLTHEAAKPKLSSIGSRRLYIGRNKNSSMLTEREYKSVEAYKEYVNNMKNRGLEGKAPTEGLKTSRNTTLGSLGYDNQALQSVIDVNQPKDDKVPDKNSLNLGDKNSIVIEIRSMWDEQLDRDGDNGRSCPANSPVPEVT